FDAGTAGSAGAATDHAARAARCALAVRAALDSCGGARKTIAVSLGHTARAGGSPVGALIDRAASQVRLPLPPPPGSARVDDVTAGLLDARFEVRGDEHGLYLGPGERELASSRTLLGKDLPCVGRELEIATLVGHFEQVVADGVARVVLITGPAGIGKSRLSREVLARIGERATV